LIQIVDDDAFMRLLMRATLEKSGFRVAESSCGKAAVTAFAELQPQAVLLDVMMPDMDGFETCRALRRRPGGEHTPILMVTGLDDVESIHKAFEAGATDFITKPVNRAILSHRLRYMLRAGEAFQAVRKKQEQIHHLAFFDHLTGLANRSAFKTSLEQALREHTAAEQQLAVLFLDLDRLKRINDTLGHHIGDLLLKCIAERITCCIRDSDAVTRSNQDESLNCVSRLGGDEFTILLTDLATPGNAGKIARRIIDSIRQPLDLEGFEVFVTASVGISLFPLDGTDAETLIKNADTAMYHAKERGRNRLQFYKKSLNSTLSERYAFENDLRQALNNREFLLYYQPQTEPHSGRIIGAEALIRWQHPSRGIIQPDQFIARAEELGLMPAMTDWVIREACRQLLHWEREGKFPISISLNLSSYQFRQQKVPEMVSRILEEYPIDPHYLVVELTESALTENHEDARSILQKLKNLGLGISIDDFGTGYSSLAYLQSFPIDTLKIDRSLVRKISAAPNDTAVIRAIAAMAHSLELKVIAEGVETEEQLDFLRRLGCKKVQGFLFSGPLPAEQFTAQMQKRSGPAPRLDEATDRWRSASR
jgi:diguanylate cyclase (GGDEF)-like protein